MLRTALRCLPRSATLVALALAGTTVLAQSADAPDSLFDHSLRRLHADEVVQLAERYAGHPVLVVNTASHCGFTRQFRQLETLHQRYKDKGLKVAGFPSDDFRQEADDEAKTAEVCFENFGVTFDMYAPIPVTGEAAHPIFREIARQSSAPEWNFHKYVLNTKGELVGSFSSFVTPQSDKLVKLIEANLP